MIACHSLVLHVPRALGAGNRASRLALLRAEIACVEALAPVAPHRSAAAPRQRALRMHLAAVVAARGSRAVAQALGRDRVTVWRWRTGRAPIPASLAPAITALRARMDQRPTRVGDDGVAGRAA